MITRGTLALIIFLISSTVLAGPLSFQQWKSRRVAEKASVLNQVKKDSSLGAEVKKTKTDQAKFNLQTEKDLSPEDYFHLYLVEQFKKNPESAKETAKSLSKDELAQIVVSYIHATNQFREVETTTSRLQTSR